MLKQYAKKFLAIKPQEKFSFFLLISFSIHILVFSLFIEQTVGRQSVQPFLIEVELINVKDGGGGGGGDEGKVELRIRNDKLKVKMGKFIYNAVKVEEKERAVPSPQESEEKKVVSLAEQTGIMEELDRSVEGIGRDAGWGSGSGGGTGSGTGSGMGSGIGTGVGSGVGSGIGSGTGSGRGSGQGSGVSGSNNELREFQRKIKERIEKVKDYPLIARKNQYEGTAFCRFTLLKDGDVKDICVVGRSGYPILDEAAKRAIREAAPYPPFPSCIEGSSIDVKVPLVFKLKDLES
jgi:TonB family protein